MTVVQPIRTNRRHVCRALILAAVLGCAGAWAQDASSQPASMPTSMASMANCHMSDIPPDPAFNPGVAVMKHPAADALVAAGEQAIREGDVAAAAQRWQEAIQQIHDAHDAAGFCQVAGRLGRAYQTLGNYRLAYPLLAKALAVADATHNDRASMDLCAALGSVLTFSRPPGDVTTDPQALLQRSVDLARQLGDAGAQAAALNDLANFYAAAGDADLAIKTFDSAATQADAAGQPDLAAQARSNAALTLAKSDKPFDAMPMLDKAIASLSSVPDGPAKAQLYVSLGRCAQTIAESNATDSRDAELLNTAVDAYNKSIALADATHDQVSLTFAWGYLGNLYEKHGGDARSADALAATRKARFHAQALQRRDALYRWEWQAGRIQAKQNDNDAAIASYQRALASLQAIRDDVAIGYGGSGFRTNVGPLFYELADLLLKRSGDVSVSDPAQSQALLQQARAAVESLKATELKNYFQDECVRVASAKQEDVDSSLRDQRHTAIVYIIPLENRTELLLSLPSTEVNGRPTLFRAKPVDIGRGALYEAARAMRYDDEDSATSEYIHSGGKLYDLLIRPIVQDLIARQITTLIFVPDGDLRLISPGALYDQQNKKFLIESFAIAVTPGLTLTSTDATSNKKLPRLLAAGLTEGRTVQLPGEAAETFDALPGVSTELMQLQNVYGAQGTTLSNQSFDQQNLDAALGQDQYSIVHLATHAQFNQDSRKTFVLAHDGPMDLNRLEQLIEPAQFRGQPVELLTLSACETAAGDDSGRAALGLAGVAIRAGARSALGTLWLANDAATSRLVPTFYRELSGPARPSKAEALQRAQEKMIRPIDNGFSHPRFWAPFLIIGNWR